MSFLCPKCMSQGEEGAECQNDHYYFVESRELAKAPEQHLLGQLVGDQFIPLKFIGEGGMGQIYKAKGKYSGKIVALKILKSEYMEDETLKDRFFREAEVIGAIEHPNIVKLYTCAPDPVHNTIYIAMELLTGKTLFQTLRRNAPKLEEVLQWFCEISDALGAAHKKGIFHRDLKPENIFICPNEDGSTHACVLDFGFARLQGASKKLTMAGVAFGTPHYMSPEQAMGMQDITAAVDVYALGVMLFQAVTGKVPYDSDQPYDVMYAQVNKPIPPIEARNEYVIDGVNTVPQALVDCITKCMQKSATERYPSGVELHEDLVKILKDIKDGNATPAAAVPAAAPAQVAAPNNNVAKEGAAPTQGAPNTQKVISKMNNTILIAVGILVFLIVVAAVILLNYL